MHASRPRLRALIAMLALAVAGCGGSSTKKTTAKFGTVSGAVYNGTVSGKSMSGSYATPRGGGSWSAKKS
jgi:hypothetical protein